jgi:hypothetical protein
MPSVGAMPTGCSHHSPQSVDLNVERSNLRVRAWDHATLLSPPKSMRPIARRLKEAEISARLAGTELTDGAHWAERYIAHGTNKAFHYSGKPGKSTWFVRDSKLCLDEDKGGAVCCQISIAGNKIECTLRVSWRPSRSVARAESRRICALKTALKEPAQHRQRE